MEKVCLTQINAFPSSTSMESYPIPILGDIGLWETGMKWVGKSDAGVGDLPGTANSRIGPEDRTRETMSFRIHQVCIFQFLFFRGMEPSIRMANSPGSKIRNSRLTCTQGGRRE